MSEWLAGRISENGRIFLISLRSVYYRESCLQFLNDFLVFRDCCQIGPFVRIFVVTVEFLSPVSILDVAPAFRLHPLNPRFPLSSGANLAALRKSTGEPVETIGLA